MGRRTTRLDLPWEYDYPIKVTHHPFVFGNWDGYQAVSNVGIEERLV